MRARQLLWCLPFCSVVALPWLVFSTRAAPRLEAAQVEGQPAAAPTTTFALVGTASCAGRACHGAIEPLTQGRVRQDEFTRWISQDRHAEAYRVLEDARSKRIEANLKHLGDWKTARPQDNAVCLSCHVFPGIGTLTHDAAFVRDFDGVGCENCHGPAEKWLGPHVQPGPAEKKKRENAELGMWPLESAADRAKVCVQCHVGSAKGDMNHDLIAAGHPRLNFEYGAYFANMPRHWVEPKPKPGDEAEAWAVGQVVSAKAALELLVSRAADPKAPWPEFAEYDCFSCHHDLHAVSWRQQRGYGDHIPGSLVPSTWYLPLPRAMAQAEKDADVVTALDGIAAVLRQPYGDRAKVARDAGKAVKELDSLLDRVTKLPYGKEAAFRKRLADLVAEQERGGLSWDEAAQLYLALAAFEEAYHPDAADEKMHKAIVDLYKSLAFPASQDSPGGDAPRDRFAKALKDLTEMLK